MKVVSVVGARPQFVKAAPLCRALRKNHTEILLHTGQHYDESMSSIFFSDLDIPSPDVNLEVGSGRHGAQTGAMLEGIEKVLEVERPDWTVVYGDTNSTLAGALAAAKLCIPLVHVEAGLRSFNRRMPEEINRVITDHLSQLNLCPSATAVEHLRREGILQSVHLVGDVMSDALVWAKHQGEGKSDAILKMFDVKRREYLLCTAHRSENTDDSIRLKGIITALNELDEPVVFPLHPRTRRAMDLAGLTLRSHVRVIPPVGYIEMVILAGSARLILTDSGGLQKEAYWLGVPCVTLREETEWTETVALGWNKLVGTDEGRIVDAVETVQVPVSRPALYGDGNVAQRCVELMVQASSCA